MTQRRVELVAGALAAVVGVAGWLWGVFGPTYTAGTYSMGLRTPEVSLARSGSLTQVYDLDAATVLYLIALLGFVLLVGIGAMLHGGRRVAMGLSILWTATLFLLAGVLLSLYTVGPFLIPAAALALVASIAGHRADAASRMVGER